MDSKGSLEFTHVKHAEQRGQKVLMRGYGGDMGLRMVGSGITNSIALAEFTIECCSFKLSDKTSEKEYIKSPESYLECSPAHPSPHSPSLLHFQHSAQRAHSQPILDEYLLQDEVLRHSPNSGLLWCYHRRAHGKESPLCARRNAHNDHSRSSRRCFGRSYSAAWPAGCRI